jgi:hypothetical protein
MRARAFGDGIGRCKLTNPSTAQGSAELFSSPGLEEYIEGLSFLHYLEHKNLISLEEVQNTLSDPETGDRVSYGILCHRHGLSCQAELSARHRHARRLRSRDV